MIRLSTAVLAVLLVAPAVAATGDPLRAQMFSGVDREAVEVGGLIEVNIEVLAVPATAEARRALAAAFGSWDVGRQLGDGLALARDSAPMEKATGDIVELQRRVIVRVTSDAVDAVPGLRLDVVVGGRRWSLATRVHPIRTYVGDAAVGAAERSVVAITAEGEIDGVGFERIGSAFAVGDDALVTAYHVVVSARRVRVTLPGGREVSINRAWALDPVRDVAVLHLPAEVGRRAGLRPLVIAPDVAEGGVAFTAGWPAGVQRRTVAARFSDLVLDGQRVRMAANAVQPGDSGGPLLDEAGRVLGVVVSGRQTGGVPDLLDEAISLASDPGPALGRYQAAEGSARLTSALAEITRMLPAARAHAAVGAIQVPARRSDWDQRSHISLLCEALRQSPDDAVLQYTAGMMLEEVGEVGLAAGALDASRRAGYVPAGYSLAHHLLSRGELAAAVGLFAETATAGPYRRLSAFGQAQALVGMGRYPAAERALEAVLDHDARFAPALYLLGIVRLAQGRVDEARALSVRLGTRPGWADALRLPIEAEALRPPRIEPLPRVALR
ncbi:trypsin-like peptidase domain-containing protein [Rubrivirga sp.]|uniref:trypsin-like peptidase domain-containing protein n=1 Tax=Rubrivirga sp. TaxID=1885344 RepID=UPI003B51E12C